MKLARYILFIPLALVAAAVFSAITKFVGEMLFGEIIGWLVAGTFGGMAFIIIGLKVAPYQTNRIKYTLAALLLTLSILSAIGSQLNASYSYDILAPIVSGIIALGAFSLPVNELLGDKAQKTT